MLCDMVSKTAAIDHKRCWIQFKYFLYGKQFKCDGNGIEYRTQRTHDHESYFPNIQFRHSWVSYFSWKRPNCFTINYIVSHTEALSQFQWKFLLLDLIRFMCWRNRKLKQVNLRSVYIKKTRELNLPASSAYFHCTSYCTVFRRQCKRAGKHSVAMADWYTSDMKAHATTWNNVELSSKPKTSGARPRIQIDSIPGIG